MEGLEVRGGSENGKVPFLYVLKESLRMEWVVQKTTLYDIWTVTFGQRLVFSIFQFDLLLLSVLNPLCTASTSLL